MGCNPLLQDFGVKMGVTIHADASAALGVIQRQGIGKLRHLHTNCLWIQDMDIKKLIEFSKVPGTRNPADVQTKNVPREVRERHMEFLKCTYREGRAGSTAQLHHIRRKITYLEKGPRNRGEERANQGGWAR